MRSSRRRSSASSDCCSAIPSAASTLRRSSPACNGGTGAVLRELARLEASGLVDAWRIGKQKHYKANPASPLFEDLRRIVEKTVRVADPLRRALGPVSSKITAAFVYGSVARKQDTAHSDNDLMIVADRPTYADVYSALESASATLGRQVNPTIYSRGEFKRRREAGNAFLSRVLDRPKLWIIGSDRELPT